MRHLRSLGAFASTLILCLFVCARPVQASSYQTVSATIIDPIQSVFYPLVVHFYYQQDALPGPEGMIFLGADVYPASSSAQFVDVSLPFPGGRPYLGSLVATTTDSATDPRTSEMSPPMMPVPEPSLWAGLWVGRWRSDRVYRSGDDDRSFSGGNASSLCPRGSRPRAA